MRKGNGDGTVPLISLGIHCRKGWKTKKLNPGGVKILTQELRHDPVPMYQDPRCVNPKPCRPSLPVFVVCFEARAFAAFTLRRRRVSRETLKP